MDFILRTRRALFRCFQKSFHDLKVKNPNVPLPKFFRFAYFVPHAPNYHSPNFCAKRTIFDRERGEILKKVVLKNIVQCPTLKVIFDRERVEK